MKLSRNIFSITMWGGGRKGKVFNQLDRFHIFNTHNFFITQPILIILFFLTMIRDLVIKQLESNKSDWRVKFLHL